MQPIPALWAVDIALAVDMEKLDGSWREAVDEYASACA